MIVQNKKILASILLMIISFVCTAAQEQAPPQPQMGTQSTPPGLPIDNGMIILFVAAVIFGIYKSYKFSKKSTQV